MQRSILFFGGLGIIVMKGFEKTVSYVDLRPTSNSLGFHPTYWLPSGENGPSSSPSHQFHAFICNTPLFQHFLLTAMFSSSLKSQVIQGPAGFPLQLGFCCGLLIAGWREMSWVCRHAQEAPGGFMLDSTGLLSSEALQGTLSGIPVGRDGQVGLKVHI